MYLEPESADVQAHFRDYLDSLGYLQEFLRDSTGKTIVVMDYAGTGASLAQVGKLLKAYLVDRKVLVHGVTTSSSLFMRNMDHFGTFDSYSVVSHKWELCKQLQWKELKGVAPRTLDGGQTHFELGARIPLNLVLNKKHLDLIEVYVSGDKDSEGPPPLLPKRRFVVKHAAKAAKASKRIPRHRSCKEARFTPRELRYLERTLLKQD